MKNISKCLLFVYLLLKMAVLANAEEISYDKEYEGDVTVTDDIREEFEDDTNATIKVSGDLVIKKGIDDFGGKYLYVVQNLYNDAEFIIGRSSDGANVIVDGYVKASKTITLTEESYLTVGLESDTSSFVTTSNLEINGTSVVEIWGSLSVNSVVVAENALLVVHGDLKITGSETEFAGTVLVTGDADIKKCQIDESGNFVVVGDLKFNDSEMDNLASLNIYSIGEGSVKNGNDDYTGSTYDLGDIEEGSVLYELLVNYGIVSFSENEWEGSNDSWNEKENWSLTKVPGRYTKVKIPSGMSTYPKISGTVNIYNLTIESGASLTVNEGGTVYICGNLDIDEDATFTVKNNLTDGAEAISSIQVDGTVTGEATEVWSNMEGYFWWYFSNPVSGDYSNEYENYSATAVGSSSYYIRLYNNSTLKYDYNISSSSYAYNALDAFAYAVLNNNTDNTLSYSGTFNNGSFYSHEATNESSDSYYQYIGNPYPSYIDFKEIYANSESTSSAEEASTCYVYTTSTVSGIRGYATYNAASDKYTGSDARYIAPGQCFWVQMNTDDIVYIKKSACTNTYDTDNPVSLKSISSSSSSKPIIRLALSNDNTYDEVLIISDDENGSDDITKYDSQKKMNSGVIGNLYTVKKDTSIAINSLPEFYDGDIIPLGYSVSSSGMTDFTIKVASLTNTDDYAIYLDDLDDGTSIELTDTAEYSFTPSEASSDDRFQIRIASTQSTEETTTGIDATSSEEISVYSSGETAYVTVSEEWLQSDTRMIYVYDVAGQLVQTEEFDDLENHFTLPGEGVYLIKVVSGSMIYTNKVLGE